jgi:hypothetical protein
VYAEGHGVEEGTRCAYVAAAGERREERVPGDDEAGRERIEEAPRGVEASAADERREGAVVLADEFVGGATTATAATEPARRCATAAVRLGGHLRIRNGPAIWWDQNSHGTTAHERSGIGNTRPVQKHTIGMKTATIKCSNPRNGRA